MPRLFLPPSARELAEGQQSVTAAGHTVREVLDAVDARYSGVKNKLTSGDAVRAGLAVVIDGAMSPRGLDTRVADDAEIHFLPPVAGG